MSSSLRRILAALAVLALASALAACGGDDDGDEEAAENGGNGEAAEVEPIEENPENADTSITIGSKNFTEQFILGEIYSQALEAAGYDVDKELNLGAEQIAFRALQSGQVDAYPEYTGTALTSFYDVEIEEAAELSPDEAYELAREEYATDDIVALPRGQFDNTYVIASLVETQEELGAETLTEVSELPEADELSISGFPECRQRTDCLLGLENVYDWTPEFVASEGQFEPIDNDQTDFGFVFGTDAELSLDQYATYEDDQDLFPPYHITLAIREEALEAIGEEGEEVILRAQEPLTEDVMRELNARVDLDQQEPQQVASDYLSETGLVE